MGVFGKMQDVHYPSSGAVAQLGERDVRNVEVRGSIPLGSTIPLKPLENTVVSRYDKGYYLDSYT